MPISKQDISSFFRKLYLAKAADTLRFRYLRLRNFKRNQRFVKENPRVILPPDYIMYESFQLDYRKYFDGGREDANWVIDTVRPYIQLNSKNILDWGCGPARIIRHLPELLGPANNYYGTDYNPTTVQWLKENIHGIIFSLNKVNPPLDFPDQFFDFIYGISVLTHLSEQNQYQWSRELNRILSPRGIILLTTHGEAFSDILTEKEKVKFNKGELVSRENVVEGHRMYGAFHPSAYISNVFLESGLEVINHIPGERVTRAYISQDVWVLKKGSDYK